MNIRCLRCKGRGFCGRDFCPLVAKTNARFKVEPKLVKQDFFGSSPAPFVGRFGYPNINVGILSPADRPDNIWEYDAPRHWSAQNYSINQVIDFRSSLINSRFNINVRQQDKLLEISQEVGMASKPVDVEVNLKKAPSFRLTQDSFMAPTGPNAPLKKARITENPKISQKVDKVVSDIHLKANDAMIYLYNHEFDENFLSRLISVGTLGLKPNRKLVPTRWSITAADDAIGKHLMQEIKNYSESNCLAYFGGYLGNYYLILLFPDVWSYELFETYAPKTSWNTSDSTQFMTDYEPYTGRKDYADNTAGGYYAARLGILEKLKQIKRQASVLALRFITNEYWAPLGVWVVREAARKAMSSKPIEFADRQLMLTYVSHLIRKKFNYNLDLLLKESKTLHQLKTQTKLNKFVQALS